MSIPAGSLCLLLHAHLPYVRHPEHEDFLEEHWLFEAITETYVPLLRAFERLEDEGVPFRITMTVTPPLVAMLGDPLLQDRYLRRLERLLELAGREVAGNAADTPVGRLSRYYRGELLETRAYVRDRWGGNLLNAFRSVQDRGSVELITCTATHGYLPLMSTDNARRAQIRVGVEAYRRAFGRSPRGIWLAECAYDEGIDALLKENGIEYFFADSHGLLLGDPRPALGIHAPVMTPHGVAVFARDMESSKQVWSSKEGYPGDPVYREYYRDLGYDADEDYIRPYLPAGGLRRSLGFKYYRVTGDVELHQKAYYDRDAAAERTAVHAGNFLFNRQAQARWLRGGLDRPPIIVSPYDAELFGHWWYEGPRFLEDLLRKAGRQGELELITASDYLDRDPDIQVQEPSPSSWGAEGYSMVWLNGGNCWFYRHQHEAERRMEELAARCPNASGVLAEALDQAARELLLAQSSDWAFIVTTGTTVPYAVRRFKEHLHRFQRLADAVESGHPDPGVVASVRGEDPIFPWLSHRVYQA
jgi:1,4-alpha-glucan branching enzyme